jgi:hypothetical protein
MSVGIVMLVHTALDRAEQMIRHWVAGGCPVVVHVDVMVARPAFAAFAARFADEPSVVFSPRFRCEWGTWGLVAATQAACEIMLARFPQAGHVYLASGSCLPLRPVAELAAYLQDRPQTDFIESATTADVPWTVGGLSEERFTLRFPFSWRRHRGLFDRYVQIQRRLGFRRRIPDGIDPHMGSQWWCLTRRTLEAILTDPQRPVFDRYFRRVWIPDESYFQTLARRHSTDIESRSLTLSKFDFQGKPHIFYDDHLQLLRRSDCFVARKIWPHAEGLYQAFLRPAGRSLALSEPNPGKIDRLFAHAVERRTRGRPGLYMQSRFPNSDHENGLTAGTFAVCEGLDALCEDFEPWLAGITGARVHGHLFAPDRAEFEGRVPIFAGCLSDSATLRDYNPQAFLTSLIWNTRGETQCFQFGPADTQKIGAFLVRDTNAQITVVSGAWAVPLFRSDRPFAELRAEAARLQRIEAEHLRLLRMPWTKARVRIMTMAKFMENPLEVLQDVVALGGTGGRQIAELPRLADLTGFGRFLQSLKNEGMHPYLMGDFSIDSEPASPGAVIRKPYLVR